jgi:hypothetical protein
VLKGRNIECSLKDMLAKNDEEFAADFMGFWGMHVPPFPSSLNCNVVVYHNSCFSVNSTPQ